MKNLTKYRLTWLYNKWTLKREGYVQLVATFGDMTQLEAAEACAQRLNGTGALLFIHQKSGQLLEKRAFPRCLQVSRLKNGI